MGYGASRGVRTLTPLATLNAAEEDNWPSDIWRSGIYLPGFGLLSNLLKVSAGWFAITTGALMARTGLLG